MLCTPFCLLQVKEELCYGSARCPKALSRLCRAAENISGTSPIAYGLAFLFSSVREASTDRLVAQVAPVSRSISTCVFFVSIPQLVSSMCVRLGESSPLAW